MNVAARDGIADRVQLEAVTALAGRLRLARQQRLDARYAVVAGAIPELPVKIVGRQGAVLHHDLVGLPLPLGAGIQVAESGAHALADALDLDDFRVERQRNSELVSPALPDRAFRV